MLVSFSRHPSGAREMAIESTAGALDVLIRVYVQHYPRHLAPVGTFRIGIQHPYVHYGVLLIVRGEHRFGRGNVGSVRAMGNMGFSRAYNAAIFPVFCVTRVTRACVTSRPAWQWGA